MLKLKIIKKFGILLLCVLIIQILRIYPNENIVANNISINKGVIYLLDNNDYLSRLEITYDSDNDEDLIREMIDILTISNDYSKIRAGFSAIIPENTKLLNMEIADDLVTLNFSKNFLDISEKFEEKLIEAIVFSITSLEKYNKVTIKVEDILLQKLPHSLKRIPEVIDRSFKINKEYNINNLENIVVTTVFYPAILDGYNYYIPVTKYKSTKKEKIEIIISELESSNTYNSNIVNYLNSETKLMNFELLDKSLLLNFDEALFGDIVSKNISEEVLYSINLSISESYNNVDSVMYLVNDDLIETHFLLLG
ncbi:MAG: GerMN domain-containing protein [Erysipelotrichales bacterium]|nr:GerMN domain-containing protein [Erysipelotrichales bacterium]